MPWVVVSAGAALLLWGAFAVAPPFKHSPRQEPPAWSQGTIRASYVGSQLKEIDKTRSSLMISYDLENDSDSDYRLTDGPGVIILSRLKSDGSYSQEQPVRLGYPVFVPAKQHARLAIEITQPFTWPAESDPAYLDKMRDFVRRRLEDVGEFVLFDDANHRQLELPSGWAQLQDTSQASD
jgi:hypothetical protein